MARCTLRAGVREYTVDVASDEVVSVDGEDVRIALRDGGNGLVLAEHEGRASRAFVAAAGDTRWVFLDGETWTLELVRPGPRPSRSVRHDQELVAPMPATVRTIAVAVGDVVEQSQIVLMLEAMKMELPIRAPRHGVVRAIHCAPGELVQPGTVLLEIDESSNSVSTDSAAGATG